MRVTLRLFLDWGITFGKPYELPEKAQRVVTYASRKELENAIHKSTHPEAENEPPANKAKAPSQDDTKRWWRDKSKSPAEEV